MEHAQNKILTFFCGHDASYGSDIGSRIGNGGRSIFVSLILAIYKIRTLFVDLYQCLCLVLFVLCIPLSMSRSRPGERRT